MAIGRIRKDNKFNKRVYWGSSESKLEDCWDTHTLILWVIRGIMMSIIF